MNTQRNAFSRLPGLLLGALLAAGCGGTSIDDTDVASLEPAALTNCTTYVQGGPTSCKPTATWTDYAEQHCNSLGKILGGYTFSTACGAGSYSYIKYTCCDPDPGCVLRTQGSTSSCKDVATWKSYAYSDCASLGMTLNTYAVRVACGGGGYRYVDYVCCP
jgi:hypothetical protein